MNDDLHRSADGTYREALGGRWTAEYAEDPAVGLWTAEVFHRDIAEWRSTGFSALEAAREAARAYYDQL
jgi:hypothetical protein